MDQLPFVWLFPTWDRLPANSHWPAMTTQTNNALNARQRILLLLLLLILLDLLSLCATLIANFVMARRYLAKAKQNKKHNQLVRDSAHD